jgi:hypothetical protein
MEDFEGVAERGDCNSSRSNLHMCFDDVDSAPISGYAWKCSCHDRVAPHRLRLDSVDLLTCFEHFCHHTHSFAALYPMVARRLPSNSLNMVSYHCIDRIYDTSVEFLAFALLPIGLDEAHDLTAQTRVVLFNSGSSQQPSLES